MEFHKEIIFKNDFALEVTVEAEGSWEYDPAYNCDADGNRGIAVWLLDEVEFSIFDARGNDITHKLEKHSKKLFAEVEDEIYKYVQENDEPEEK